MGPVLGARCSSFRGHPSAGAAVASPEQGVTALRGRNNGDLGGQTGIWEGCALAELSSAASFIPEDGHFTAWLQAEQRAGGKKL